jgi:septal ring factor EnvC (AmiA/AmiB activator)
MYDIPKQKVEEVTMPGFLDKLKSGADKAAFEADRMLRLNQAQSALKQVQRDLETELAALGQQVMELYDAGNLTQPELAAMMPKIDAARQKITAQEAEVERIRQEKGPEAGAQAPAQPSAPVQASAMPSPPPQPVTPVAQGRTCANCGSPLPEDVRFCPECGARVEEA